MATKTFTIPESVRSLETDPKSLTFTTLNMAQELDAMAVAEKKAGGGLAFNYECMRRSCIKVDGKPVTWEGTGPEWIERSSQKVLTLALRAHHNVNTPSDKESADFLASGVVEA